MLLVSVIFVALFLFIITIVDNPMGLVQDHTTVAKVKGDKIDYENIRTVPTSCANRTPMPKAPTPRHLRDSSWNR